MWTLAPSASAFWRIEVASTLRRVWLVESLPLGALRWLVLVVVAYTSITLLRAGTRSAAAEDKMRVG